MRKENESNDHMPCQEIEPNDHRPCQEFNLAPTGHKIPVGRSPDDPAMSFIVPDCGVEMESRYAHPLFKDEDD